MKTYVITLSQVFPTTHPKAGIPTGFKHSLQATLNGWGDLRFAKLHTIRANYPLWAKRFEQIERGEACLSIRQWSGKPYASKQVEIGRLTKEDGIGLQKLSFDSKAVCPLCHPTIDGSARMWQPETIAANDGLYFVDWQCWFDKYDLSKPLAIIHFTGFRY